MHILPYIYTRETVCVMLQLQNSRLAIITFKTLLNRELVSRDVGH